MDPHRPLRQVKHLQVYYLRGSRPAVIHQPWWLDRLHRYRASLRPLQRYKIIRRPPLRDDCFRHSVGSIRQSPGSLPSIVLCPNVLLRLHKQLAQQHHLGRGSS